jgi:hypothetical protein
MISFSDHGRAEPLKCSKAGDLLGANTAGARHPNDADCHRGGGRLDFGTSIVVTPRLEVLP